MKDRVLAKANIASKIQVIPPWSHDDVLADVPHAVNPFRKLHGLNGAFVVMYAGNHGYATPVEAMLGAARLLSDDPRIMFMFIGGGVRKLLVDEYVTREKPTNVISLPYQPLAEIRFSLSAADVHLVSIAPEGVGIVHPCKIYGALAIGRPVIAISPRNSYAADILRDCEVGWLCERSDAESLAALVRRVASLSGSDVARLQMNAKQLASESFRSDRLRDAVCELLSS